MPADDLPGVLDLVRRVRRHLLQVVNELWRLVRDDRQQGHCGRDDEDRGHQCGGQRGTAGSDSWRQVKMDSVKHDREDRGPRQRREERTDHQVGEGGRRDPRGRA